MFRAAPERFVAAATRRRGGFCAGLGECESNAEFMVGHAAAAGRCRLACGVCTPCASEDAACLARSRDTQGYLNIGRDELKTVFEA